MLEALEASGTTVTAQDLPDQLARLPGTAAMNLGPGTTIVALLVWGTIVGVDLVSVPQALLSRPLVAAGDRRLAAGQPRAGLRVGLVLELFALDVLPVGAARYPDYGAGTVGAVLLSTGGPLGADARASRALRAGLAVLGGSSLLWLRQRQRPRAAARVRPGSPRAMRGQRSGLQYRG